MWWICQVGEAGIVVIERLQSPPDSWIVCAGAPQTGGLRVFLTPLGTFLPPYTGFHSEI
jgi:hypothetical protein